MFSGIERQFFVRNTTATPAISTDLAAPVRSPTQVDHSRVPELDGIRAIAIWMVLVGHIFYGWTVPAGTFAHIPGFLLQTIAHGWLGVDLFFVLSGFLITGILLDSRRKNNYFRNFYARRFLRIMPLYFVVVIVFAIFYSRAREYLLLSTFFGANLANLFGVAVPHGPGILWSLAVEEHFYLLWPLLVFWLDGRRVAILAILIIVVTPIARGLAVAHGMPIDAAVYVYSWFRFDGLALGGLLAVWARSGNANRANSYRLAAVFVGLSVVITMIGAPLGLMQKGALGTALRFNQAQVVFAAFLLVALALQGTRFTAFLRAPFARLSGSLSYCIYLIHLALGDGYQATVHRLNLPVNATFGNFGEVIVRGIFVVLTSFGLAMLSRKYLEEPFLRLKRFF